MTEDEKFKLQLVIQTAGLLMQPAYNNLMRLIEQQRMSGRFDPEIANTLVDIALESALNTANKLVSKAIKEF